MCLELIAALAGAIGSVVQALIMLLKFVLEHFAWDPNQVRALGALGAGSGR